MPSELKPDLSYADMLERADADAAKALKELNDQPNKIGSARIFGDRTIGMDDPGMVALMR